MIRARIIVNGMYLYKDTLFFSDKESNALFSLNTKSKEISFIGRFTAEPKLEKYLYYNVLEYNKKLYFIPEGASNVGVYDIENNEIMSISIPGIDVGEAGYYCGAIREKKVYFFGWPNNKVLVYDFNKEEYEKEMQISEFDKMCISDAKTVGNEIYAVSLIFNGIICIDINNQYQTIEFENNNMGFRSISIYKNKIILTPNNSSPFIEFDIKNKTYKKIYEPDKQILNAYSAGVIYQNMLMVIPNQANDFLSINLNDYTVKRNDELSAYYEDNKAFGTHTCDGRKLYIYKTEIGKMLCINKDRCEEFKIICDVEDDFYDGVEVFQERKSFNLNDYLHII